MERCYSKSRRKTLHTSAPLVENLSGQKTTLQETQNEKSKKSLNVNIPDEQLLEILLKQPDDPLLGPGNVDAVPSNASLTTGDENTPPSLVLRQSGRRQSGVEKESSLECFQEMQTTPKPLEKPKCNVISKKNPFLARIQQDLRSPSAATKVRALAALRNRTKGYYGAFDVPHEEQDIITEEERKSPARPKSIQEVMRDVVAYVEVRTGTDNCSSGVKEVISLLGARVNDTFLRDTTHVIFKDGRLSTYNKAKKWKIPMVSVLWIEACKTQMKLVDPKIYPISNVERYENPELYAKIKRPKSMQPNAEEKIKRCRTKHAQKTEVEKTVDVSSKFQIPEDKVDEIITNFYERLISNTSGTEEFLPLGSRFLERIRNSPYVSKPGTKDIDEESVASVDAISNFSNQSSDPKDNCSSNTQDHIEKLSIREFENNILEDCTREERIVNNVGRKFNYNTLLNTNEKDKVQVDYHQNGLSTNNKSICRRTSTLKANKDIEIEEMLNPGSNSVNQNSTKNTVPSKRRSQAGKRRKTSFTEHSLEMSLGAKARFRATTVTPLAKKSTHRRTLYTPSPMEESIIQDKQENSGNKNNALRRRTLFNPSPQEKTLESMIVSHSTSDSKQTDADNTPKTPGTILESHASSFVFNSAKKPQSSKRRTLFDLSMDIIDRRLQNINNSVKKNNTDCNNLDISITLNSTQSNNNNTEANNAYNYKETRNTPQGNEVLDNIPKKRKLFVPADMMLTPPLPLTKDTKQKTSGKILREDDEINDLPSGIRKTLFITPLTAKKKKVFPNAHAFRRSSLDFEGIKRVKTSGAINKEQNMLPYLVYTNMHAEQIDFIKENNYHQKG